MKKSLIFAKKLRKNLTDTEKLLWYHLRKRQLNGLKFRKQAPIGRFVVDFVCLEKRVIIEIDGSQHLLQTTRDQKRDLWLQKEGYRILRFWNSEVFEHTEEVLEIIFNTCRDHPPPYPLPSKGGGMNRNKIYT